MDNKKAQLKKLRSQLPYGYAQEVIRRLTSVKAVTRSHVYNVAQGVSTDLAVLNTLTDIAIESSAENEASEKKLAQIS